MSLMTSSRTDEGSALGAVPVVLPRVNLLPPEIAEGQRLRRIQYGLGGAVLASLGAVGLLFLSASSSATSAQEELAVETTQSSQLQAEVAKYAPVTGVYAQAAAARALLTQAMGEEVRYSTLLSNLSLSIPEKVWVKSLTFNQTPPTPVLGAAAGAGIGTLQVTGVGFSHDDVAVWLESLASQKGYANPYFSNSTEALLGTRKTVNFTSSATLTADAYSGDYTKPAGG